MLHDRLVRWWQGRKFPYSPDVPRPQAIGYQRDGRYHVLVRTVRYPDEILHIFNRRVRQRDDIVFYGRELKHPDDWNPEITALMKADYLNGRDYFPPRWWQFWRWFEPRYPDEVIQILHQLRS